LSSGPIALRFCLAVFSSTFDSGDVPDRWCCVVGNESNGISQAVVLSCHHTIRIDMDDGVDSLSLPIATGILLHGLRERGGLIVSLNK
jgi:tRNA G18 (ribose-2'-O)-methylase SpoU